MNMDFGANRTPIEVIKEGAFAGTYFKDISSSVTGKWYIKSWKEFNDLKRVDSKCYCSNYFDIRVKDVALHVHHR